MRGRALANGRPEIAVIWPQQCPQIGRARGDGRPKIGKIWSQNLQMLWRALADGRPKIGKIWRQSRPGQCGRGLANGRPGIAKLQQRNRRLLARALGGGGNLGGRGYLSGGEPTGANFILCLLENARPKSGSGEQTAVLSAGGRK